MGKTQEFQSVGFVTFIGVVKDCFCLFLGSQFCCGRGCQVAEFLSHIKESQKNLKGKHRGIGDRPGGGWTDSESLECLSRELGSSVCRRGSEARGWAFTPSTSPHGGYVYSLDLFVF